MVMDLVELVILCTMCALIVGCMGLHFQDCGMRHDSPVLKVFGYGMVFIAITMLGVAFVCMH